MSDSAGVCGLVLAAGAGTRFGRPKALARSADGTPWVALAVQALLGAGVTRVVVALGASADEARGLVPPAAEVVVVPDWEAGVSASLRSGLEAAEADAEALVVVPVDTPGMPASAVVRIIGAAGSRSSLVQAVYRGRPGHPVLIGADHFAPLARAMSGDVGARPYLVANGVVEVECGDLWSGDDVDTER